MKYTLQDLWKLACAHDGIEPDAKFVVFSKENPWMEKYSALMTMRYLQGQLGKGKP